MGDLSVVSCKCGWDGKLSECRNEYVVKDFFPEMLAGSEIVWRYLCPRCGAVVLESEKRVA